jgi:hypothetical protein
LQQGWRLALLRGLHLALHLRLALASSGRGALRTSCCTAAFGCRQPRLLNQQQRLCGAGPGCRLEGEAALQQLGQRGAGVHLPGQLGRLPHHRHLEGDLRRVACKGRAAAEHVHQRRAESPDVGLGADPRLSCQLLRRRVLWCVQGRARALRSGAAGVSVQHTEAARQITTGIALCFR